MRGSRRCWVWRCHGGLAWGAVTAIETVMAVGVYELTTTVNGA